MAAAAASASLSSSTLIKSDAVATSQPHLHPRSSFLAIDNLSKSKNPIRTSMLRATLKPPTPAAAAVRAEFDMSIFSRDLGDGDGDEDADPENEEHECPPGLRRYETMVLLRPNMSEDERLAFTHKYEQLLADGGGLHVEVMNKGVRPLAYAIKKRNKAGEANTYLDSIQILFTYFTKPESISIIVETLQTDDDVVRSSTFKIRKRKY